MAALHAAWTFRLVAPADQGVARIQSRLMLLDLRCCCSKNVGPHFQSVDAKPEDGFIVEVRSSSGYGGDGGSNVGNGGNGQNGQGHGGNGQNGEDQNPSYLALGTEFSGREERGRVRSFCCLSVDPVFDGSEWSPLAEREEYWRPCLLPDTVQAEIVWKLVSGNSLTDSRLGWVRKQVEDWYHSQGYVLAKVVGFSGLESGRLCCRISEGKIVKIRVLFRDENGICTPGRAKQDVVRREFPRAVAEGMVYNTFAVKEAIHRIFQLQLFEKVHAEFALNAEHGGVTVDFLIQEQSQDACFFQTGLSFIASESGRPILSSVRPAATLSVEHRNIAGMNRTLQGYIHSSDLLSPQDDSRFKLEYVHPNIDGLSNPRNRAFRVSCYNSRKLAAVFSHPRNEDHVPAVWVDRAGLKTSITEKFANESKLSYGFVVEEVATRDNMGTIQGPAGSSAIEHVPFLHAKITRDNTRYVHGGRVGAIDTFQVEQGVGLGTKTSFFNKHQISAMRYIPLQIKSKQHKAIVRVRYGGILGDNPRYRSFTTGGPYALRASNSGELGSCSGFLELMGELRVPVRDSNYGYAYLESFTELDGFLYHGQSFKGLASTAANGILLGMGMKISGWRTEFVFDCGARTGSVNVQLGERC